MFSQNKHIMGAAGSVEELRWQAQQNKQIELDIKKQIDVEERSQKLLLLGPGESGKSTVLKQMRILHCNGFSDAEVEHQGMFIRLNLIQSIISLVDAMSELQIPVEDKKIQKDMKLIEALSSQEPKHLALDSELAAAISRLWADGGVQKCYQRRNEFQLIDSAKYYLDAVDRIASPGYRATIDDMLRCRTKTTGVVEVQFQLKTLLFRIVDVGGQRSERRKWIQCFDGVNSIIFIASLSEYNQKLEEDNETNRMRESLNLFRWVCNHKIFIKTPIILFLNKLDLFEEKIEKIPLSIVFPDFKGHHSSEDCKMKIKQEYMKQNENLDRDIYCHFTCATDTRQISFILQSTIDSIVQDNIKGAGLV